MKGAAVFATRERRGPRDLEGAIALVTGGRSGIGAACVDVLTARGAIVVVGDVDVRSSSSAADGPLHLQMDVADPSSVERALAEIEQRYGRLDVAVNNAGIGVSARRAVADIELEAWRRVRSVDLDGVFHCLRAEIPLMLRGGGGAIVNVASVMGLVATTGAAAYVAAKHGVVGLTKAAALDYAADAIRVNCVAPGFVDTPMLGAYGDSERRQVATRHPIGRLVAAHEVAAVVAMLVSAESSAVTGTCVAVDGGYVVQ